MAIAFIRPENPPPSAQYCVMGGGNNNWYIDVLLVDRKHKVMRIDLFNGDDLEPTLTARAPFEEALQCGENIAWHIGVNTADVEIFIYWIYRIVICATDELIPKPELHAILS